MVAWWAAKERMLSRSGTGVRPSARVIITVWLTSGRVYSAFNADAVKNVTLYKGSFPARFGGRLSSVLDVTTNNGNDKEIHGNASIGFISAKLNIEGPIVKEKTTFCLSARRTYARP